MDVVVLVSLVGILVVLGCVVAAGVVGPSVEPNGVVLAFCIHL